MNGVPNDYEGSCTMKADGTWYINRISCGDETIAGWGAKIHLFMTEAETQLAKHNIKKEEPEKKEK